MAPEQKLRHLNDYMYLWIDSWSGGSFAPMRFQAYLSRQIQIVESKKAHIVRKEKTCNNVVISISTNVRNCQYCGRNYQEYGLRASIDHIIPKQAGGFHGPVIECCHECNTWKSHYTLSDWCTVIGLSLKYQMISRPRTMPKSAMRMIQKNIPRIQNQVLTKCGVAVFMKTQ